MNSPPIALFTYNRPEKTEQMLRALASQNIGRIYIYCDGPKNNDLDRLLVQKNQEIVKKFPLAKKQIIISDKNKGLATSIIDGVSNTFRFEDELIILEDDCLPFDTMCRFMAENLWHWRGYKDIFSVSCYHFIRPYDNISIPFDVFCSNRFLPWGWGTWKDRWQAIISELKDKKNPYGSFVKVPDIAGRDLVYHAYAVEKRMVDSWAIPLGLITLHKGYRHVMPIHPLVNNTGMDDSGTNTGSAHNRIIPVIEPPGYSFPITMCPHNFFQVELNKLFIDSLDVMLPPEWLLETIQSELCVDNYIEDSV